MFSTSASRFAQRSGYRSESKAKWIAGSFVALLWSDCNYQKGRTSTGSCAAGAVEIVRNSYMYPLCIVICFARGCYVFHILASLGPCVGESYNFSYRRPLAGCKISKLFCRRKLLTMRTLWRDTSRTARNSNGFGKGPASHPHESNQPQQI